MKGLKHFNHYNAWWRIGLTEQFGEAWADFRIRSLETSALLFPYADVGSKISGDRCDDKNSNELSLMKKKIIFLAASIVAIGMTITADAQVTGVKRTDLQRYDLSVPGREVVQARIDIAPGVLAPKHSHPGEEIIYVLEGLLEYVVEGKAPVTLKAGDVLFIPAGAVHSAKNVGTVNAAELATYFVEKGKPLLVAR